MFPLIFGSVFVLTGLVPILLAAKTFAKDRAIAKWPRVPGKITSSSFEMNTSTGRDEDGYTRSYTTYVPVVHFTYTVEGRELQGDRLTRVTVASDKKPDVRRYAPGQEVQVYCDP